MGRKILVVDGSSLARRVLQGYLQRELPNAEVELASNGAQARERLAAGDLRYHLVTTALMLPDMDGLDLCRSVRASALHQSSPVLVVSSDADERIARGGFEAGVTEFFDKARGFEALGAFIKDFVQRSPGHVGQVLFVEDSKTAAAHGRRVMERQGLTVDHVVSAEEAMARLDTASTLPDLVVTDYFLQGRLTGDDLLRFIRVERRLSPYDLPVLVVTGQSGEGRHAEVLHRGANDFIEKPIVEEIMMARIRSLLLLKQGFDALRRQSERMRRMAFTDSLTGVRNKRFLLEHGEAFLGAPANQPVAVMITDLDHFKQVNDTHGHLTGDRVLEDMGMLLNELFPEPAGHFVCRFGGEEFVLLLRGTPATEASTAADRLRKAIAARRPGGLDITASIGVASAQTHAGAPITRLVALADLALYAAKQSGRDCAFLAAADGPERA